MILGSSIRTIIYDKCVCFWHVLLLVITMQCFASRSNAMCLFLLHTDAQLRCSHSDKQIFLQCLIQTNTALVFASGQKCTRLIALSARPRLFSGWMSQWTIPWTTRNSAIFGCVFPSVRRARTRSGHCVFLRPKSFTYTEVIFVKLFLGNNFTQKNATIAISDKTITFIVLISIDDFHCWNQTKKH